MESSSKGHVICEKPNRSDWVAMGEIYNQSVRKRQIPQINPMTEWQSNDYFARCEEGNVPTIVARLNDQVVGWVMAHPMVWGGITTLSTADICVYVDEEHAGKLSGVALRMMSAIIRPIVLAGYERLTIWTYGDNQASQGLAQAVGMTQWGFLPQVAKMDEDCYKDVTIWGVELNEATLSRWDRVIKRLTRQPS